MQKHNDMQWLRRISTLEVAISNSDVIWKVFGVLHFLLDRHPVRAEALFRQVQQRQSGLNSPTPGARSCPPDWHKEVLPVHHKQMLRKRVP
jgi:hypothetical protein